MPVTNQFESSNNKFKLPTLKIGERSNPPPIGEDSECEHCISDSETETPGAGELPENMVNNNDYYFEIVLNNIGTFSEFTKLYNYNINNSIIGHGTETIVYSGTNIITNNKCAIKETILNTKTDLINYFNKYLIIKQCNFYNIYDAYLQILNNNKYKIILIQELFSSNITEIMHQNAIENNNNCNLSETEIRKIIINILNQLNQLNALNNNYNHLDIKPTNIMRTLNGNYTLIDFNLYNNDNGQYIGTKNWSAPEINPNISNNIIYETTDVWSIGLVIIYSLFNGKHPFQTKNKINNIKYICKWYNKKIKNKQLFIEKWLNKQLINNKISYLLFDFLFKCMKYNPKKRMNIKQALKHKWLIQ